MAQTPRYRSPAELALALQGSIAAFARWSGFSESYTWDILKRGKNPSERFITAIEAYTGIPSTALFPARNRPGSLPTTGPKSQSPSPHKERAST
jgi:hypothetical protein